MTQKTIERLFPCDTSMVVVIDDRADVWQYSPNLVKVHPCKVHCALDIRTSLADAQPITRPPNNIDPYVLCR